MKKHAEALENSCSPLQLITGLGLDPMRTGDQYTTTCPACQHRLYILQDGFLCENIECDFRAGSTLDFLKMSKGLNSYMDSVEYLENIFPNIHDPIGFRNQRKEMASATRVLGLRRKLYEYLLSISRTSVDDYHYMQTYGQLKKIVGVSMESNRMVVFPIPKHKYDELEAIAKGYGINNFPDLRGTQAFLLPYFTNHHTVGVLGYKRSIEDCSWNPIPLEPKRYQFCGLMQAQPSAERYTLVSSYAKLLRKNSELAEIDPGAVALHSLYNPKTRELP